MSWVKYSQPESFVSFRPPAFSRCSSLRIFPNALSAKNKIHQSNMRPVHPFLYELGALTNRAGTKPIRFWLARRRGHSTEIEKRDDQEKNGVRDIAVNVASETMKKILLGG
jgi:hypothetical protein